MVAPAVRRLYVATANVSKLAEFQRIFGGSPIELAAPPNQWRETGVAETGETFVENARLKARAGSGMFGGWILADDSGLEVDALGGEPGVRSSRYAGRDASDDDRIALLLGRLAAAPPAARTAHFRCALVIAAPDGSIVFETEGRCEGRIADRPRGTHGFGYDPIFVVGDGKLTMAELAPAEKDRLSHRGQAARAARDFLLRGSAPA